MRRRAAARPSVAVAAVLLLALQLAPGALAVDRSKFHTCRDTGFCRRNRNKPAAERPRYYIDSTAVDAAGGAVDAAIFGGPVHLHARLQFYDSGVARLQVREQNPLRVRWELDDVVLDEQLTAAPIELLSPDDPRVPSAVRARRDARAQQRLEKQQASGGGGGDAGAAAAAVAAADQDLIVLYGAAAGSGGVPLICDVAGDPIVLAFFEGEELTTTVNGAGLLHFEHHRSRDGTAQVDAAKEDQDRHKGKEVVGYWEDGLAIYADGSREERRTEPEGQDTGDGFWEERIKGHSDSKPNGPSSVGVDVTFHGSTATRKVFGIPEHATRTALPHTTGPRTHYNEPYRLYNLDVFEYELDEPMALYGAIPFVVSHGVAGTTATAVEGATAPATTTVGALWLNPSETYVDVGEDSAGTETQIRWISESGIVDLLLLPGPSPRDVYKQYGQLTGTQELPPLFALGYHQCRWNYKNEADVEQVHATFEELDFPYDVLWLDIEHTEGKRYFTWDHRQFKHPLDMQAKLAAQGRRMVTIVDPHIKRDSNYYVYKEGHEEGFFLLDSNGKEYDGYCWPGGSGYLDFTSPSVRGWWAQQFALDKYQGSTVDLFTWNDMNEPSVFNGPEVSMSKDAQNLAGVEHREWHNVYGQLFQRSSAEGLVLRHLPRDEALLLKSPASSSAAGSNGAPPPLVAVDLATVQRPFVLSRAFFAGSQRFGAVWTGDNAARWDHLQAAAPMLLGINLGGLSFAGADVGGFFGNPSAELMTRWHQAASYQPFFRGHAHLDSKRREPWVFGDPTTGILRAATAARYALLPYWYTTFFEASVSGFPVMRATWLEFPADPGCFALDDQWLVGAALLVKPVVEEGAEEVEVYFPRAGTRWFDVDTLAEVALPDAGAAGGVGVRVAAPIDKVPAFQRGGTVVPRKSRLRRSSKLMKYDPLTLTIALDAAGGAAGQLYADDELTYAYWDEAGAAPNYHRRQFRFSRDDVSREGAAPADVYRFTNRAIPAGTKDRVSHTTTLHDALLDSDMYYGHIKDDTRTGARTRSSGLLSSALNAVAGIFHAAEGSAAGDGTAAGGSDAEASKKSQEEPPRRSFHSASAAAAGVPDNEVERVVVLGFPAPPARVVAVEGAGNKQLQLQFHYSADTKVLAIRQPLLHIGTDFDVEIHMA